MFDDLIEFDDVLESSDEVAGFEEVTFLRDFGPYRSGDRVSSRWFNLSEGKASSFSREDELENTWKFKIVTA